MTHDADRRRALSGAQPVLQLGHVIQNRRRAVGGIRRRIDDWQLS